jgi:hypothetical protein
VKNASDRIDALGARSGMRGLAMRRALVPAVVVTALLASCDESAIYMNDVTENTLGYPYSQFSEAYLVANSHARDPDDLLRVVRTVCAKFPNLDSYLVRVFTDAKWATADAYDWDFPPMIVAMPKGLADAYMAEINPGKGLLTLYPFKYPPVTATIGPDWCKDSSAQAAARPAEPAPPAGTEADPERPAE